MKDLVRVEALSFSYGQRHLYTRWSHVFGGGLTWLRGPNGCGKSTLLKLIGAALPLPSGRILIDGIDETLHPMRYRRQVFWCGPGAVVFDHLTPAEYASFIAGLYPSFDNDELRLHIDGFSLQAHWHRRLRELSTGTARKVALAVALAAGTRVTLLDEPTNALDSGSLSHLKQSLLRLAKDDDRAWIIACHADLPEIAPLASVIDLSAAPAVAT